LLELIEEKYRHLDDLAQTAEFARHTYDRLVELINEVKSFVRQQHSETVLQPLALTETLHELMDFLRYDATLPVRAVRLEMRAEPTVRANKTKLQQVLVNLLKNAAYAIGNCPEGRIVVSLECEADQAVLRVRDNGCGMTPDVLERIWEPFFTTKGASGTGLGLDISRSIIESHGGRIDCESAPGCGATFTIRLPIVPLVVSQPVWPGAAAGPLVFPASDNASSMLGEYPRI
jgi:two-component system, NtrC family, sensor kinase